MASPQHSSGPVVPIPRSIQSSTDLESIVKRYKDLRLLGLRVDPESFSSIYEEEVKFAYETWRSRIQNPMGTSFVALSAESNSGTRIEASSTDSTIERLLREEWMGIITVLGPVPFHEPSGDEETIASAKPGLHTAFIKDRSYIIPSPLDAQDADMRGSHVVFLIVGLFILPQARRGGLASRLVEASINHVRAEAIKIGASKASLSIQVAPTNIAGKLLYERLGFFVSENEIVMNSRRGGEEITIGLEMEVGLRKSPEGS